MMIIIMMAFKTCCFLIFLKKHKNQVCRGGGREAESEEGQHPAHDTRGMQTKVGAHLQKPCGYHDGKLKALHNSRETMRSIE